MCCEKYVVCPLFSQVPSSSSLSSVPSQFPVRPLLPPSRHPVIRSNQLCSNGSIGSTGLAFDLPRRAATGEKNARPTDRSGGGSSLFIDRLGRLTICATGWSSRLNRSLFQTFDLFVAQRDRCFQRIDVHFQRIYLVSSRLVVRQHFAIFPQQIVLM